MRSVAVLLVLLTACGARTERREPDASSADVRGIDSGAADISFPEPCVGRPVAPDEVIDLFVPIDRFSLGFDPVVFTHLMAGIEPAGTHSCPRFFFRAGTNAEYDGLQLNIEVPYPFEEGVVTEAELIVTDGFTEELWREAIRVTVNRADGLLTILAGDPRGQITVDHHDATTDLVINTGPVPYCSSFPLCL